MESYNQRFFVGSPQFETLVDYKLYVNYQNKCAHYKAISVTDDSLSYLWTKDAGFCIPIALIHKKEGEVKAIGLYHSVTEHSLHSDQSKYFEKSIKKFLKGIDDPKNVTIVMSFNPLAHSTSKENDIGLIKQAINYYCHELHKSTIPENNFIEFKGSDTFFIRSDGEYGILFTAAKSTLSTVKETIKNFLIDNNLYLSNILEPILKIIYQSGPNSIDTLEEIKQKIGIFLNDAYRQNSDEEASVDIKYDERAIELFEQIVAWDLVLNAPSQTFFDRWLLDNGHYQVNSDSEESSPGDEKDEKDERKELNEHLTKEKTSENYIPNKKTA